MWLSSRTSHRGAFLNTLLALSRPLLGLCSRATSDSDHCGRGQPNERRVLSYDFVGQLEDKLLPLLTGRLLEIKSRSENSRYFSVALVAPVEIPPSTSRVCPVTYSLASDARKITAPSRSFGFPGRFTGMRSQMYSSH